MLLIEARGTMQWLRRIQGYPRAPMAGEFCLSSLQQFFSDASALPLRQDGHAAQMSFACIDHRASDSADNLAVGGDRDEDAHLREAMLDCLRR